MTDWIKAWGLPSQPLQDDWKNHKSGLLTRRATFPRRPSVRPGDRLFYYAVGHRVLFAIYEVVSLPFQAGGDDRYDWHVKVERIVELEFVHDGVPVEDIKDVGGRNLLVSLRQKPAIRLREPEATAAETALQDRVERITEGGERDG